MSAAVEAVVFDYGGVISTPFEPHLSEFEAIQGYPAGSLPALFFGDEGYQGGGSAVPSSPVVHDWHRLEIGEIDIATFIAGVEARAPEVLGRAFDVGAFAEFMAGLAVTIHWPIVHRARALRADGLRLAILTNNVKEFASTWRGTLPSTNCFRWSSTRARSGCASPIPGSTS